MKLGFLSVILGEYSFEKMIDKASELGYETVEVACWKNQKAERRYSGVCHIDTEALDKVRAQEITDYCKKKNVAISALAFYPNTMDEDLNKREENIAHLKSVIDASVLLDVRLVNTFIGKMQSKTVEENLKEVKSVWVDILTYAKEKGVRIAIENCPMLFGSDQWPGGQNLMSSPKLWREVFELLPFDNLGLNFDPSHFVWQMLDYVQAVYDFKDKIFHIHFKDIKVYQDKLATVGTMAYPLEYMQPKLPGLGNVNWSKFVSALTDIKYDGYTAVEVEDKAFEDSEENVIKSLILSKRYIEQFLI